MRRKIFDYCWTLLLFIFFISCSDKQTSILSGKPCQTKADCDSNQTCHQNRCQSLCFNDFDCNNGYHCDLNTSHVCIKGPKPLSTPSDDNDTIACDSQCKENQICENGSCKDKPIITDAGDSSTGDDDNTLAKKPCREWFSEICKDELFLCAEKISDSASFQKGDGFVLNCDLNMAVSDPGKCFADCSLANAKCVESTQSRCVIPANDDGNQSIDDNDNVCLESCAASDCGKTICGKYCGDCQTNCTSNYCQDNPSETFACSGKGWYPCATDSNGCRFINKTVAITYEKGKCSAVCNPTETQGCSGGASCSYTNSNCCTQSCANGVWGTCIAKTSLPSECTTPTTGCTKCDASYDCICNTEAVGGCTPGQTKNGLMCVNCSDGGAGAFGCVGVCTVQGGSFKYYYCMSSSLKNICSGDYYSC